MALTVRGVSKSFGERKAVDGISFEIPSPEIFGLIGTNGAGKTTTIRMILGVLEKDAGDILWDGRPFNRDEVRVGYMPEERGLYPKVAVAEQLIYFGMLRGMPKDKARAATERWLERLGITEYRNVRAEALSKGNQQKVQLIASLVHDPQLLFLDEPFSGLDPINTDVFRDVFRELEAEGKYIVLSSHQMATVEEYCRHIVLLNRGHTLLSGSLHEIKSSYGHTHLFVSCGQDITPLAAGMGLKLEEKKPDGYAFGIAGDAQAQAFLKALVDNGIYPERYEIRMPSLHELFVRSVRQQQGEEEAV
nr:ATP-binding cassette domain-containing protein [bacterium]